MVFLWLAWFGYQGKGIGFERANESLEFGMRDGANISPLSELIFHNLIVNFRMLKDRWVIRGTYVLDMLRMPTSKGSMRLWYRVGYLSRRLNDVSCLSHASGLYRVSALDFLCKRTLLGSVPRLATA